MPKGYKHLTYEQRCQIEVLLKRRILQKEIAETMKISRSQLCREIKRGANKDGSYNGTLAQRKHKMRKNMSAINTKKVHGFVEKYIIEKLKLGWSPKQISGRLWRDHRKTLTDVAIYLYIKNDRKYGGRLYLQLRRKGRKKRDYNRKRAGKSLIPNRVDITERPIVVESKLRFGDWEGDTIVGKGHKSGLITLVERKSKLLLMLRIDSFKADYIAALIISALEKVKNKLHTITFDNGLEFASHHKIVEHFKNVATYFAKPFRSWQRGLNEHTNGLIREFFPKGTDFSSISDEEVYSVQNKLNNRPRSVLNFRTPEEVFFRFSSAI